MWAPLAHARESGSWSTQSLRQRERRRRGSQQRDGRREYVIDVPGEPAIAGSLRLDSSGRSRYREFQVTGHYRTAWANDLVVSYVRSSATGDLNVTDHFNPRDYQGNQASGQFGRLFNGVGRTLRGKFVLDF